VAVHLLNAAPFFGRRCAVGEHVDTRRGGRLPPPDQGKLIVPAVAWAA